MQAVFNTPVLSNHLIEPLGRQDLTEQVVGSFGRGFVCRLAPSNHFADGLLGRSHSTELHSKATESDPLLRIILVIT